MRYLIDISPIHGEKIKELVETNQYQSFSQFLHAAIENQLLMETSPLLSAHEPFSSLDRRSVDNPKDATPKRTILDKYILQELPISPHVLDCPDFKQLVLSTTDMKEEEAWIWGQINKIFPIKLGVRLLHKCLESDQFVEHSKFLDFAAKEAALIGDIVRDYEEKNNRGRGDKISAALPSHDENSQARYKYQFLAYRRKDGLLDGAMGILRFCNIKSIGGKVFIGLTDQGLKFSKIISSVIDKKDFDESITSAEAAFYFTHVREFVKGEFNGISWMLNRISSGVNKREALNVELKHAFGKKWNATDSVINTQRAGLIARMFDLHLIEKVKDGINVTYKATDAAKKFLNLK